MRNRMIASLFVLAFTLSLPAFAQNTGGPQVGDEDEAVAAWCGGYLRAARMDNQWRTDDRGWCLLFPLGVLAGQFDLTGEVDPEGNVIEDSTSYMQRYREMLPVLVTEMNAYWTRWRREHLPIPVNTARSTQVGRNEPCPCGSGRKYKRCCALDVS